MSAESFIRNLLSGSDIEIGGNKPYDLRLLDERFYDRILNEGSLGFGEAYMEGWFECERLDQLIDTAYRAGLINNIDKKEAFFAVMKSRARKLGSRAHSFDIGSHHYDAGNDIYRAMLDDYMMYSCGYWKRAETLAEAQADKLELTCRKMLLQPGMRVLDIGCGWGGFPKYAAEKFGVSVVGTTVSKNQLALGQELCQGLPVELRYQDYRETDERFDRIVSIGMFEHVGRDFFAPFFEACDRCLESDGILLLHTVGYKDAELINPWFDKYIMPGVAFPTMTEAMSASASFFTLEDFHSWDGAHYDKTLMAWFEKFDAAWHGLKANYSEIFYRMWKLYLQGCAGAFRADRMRVWQLVFAKAPIPGGYAFKDHYPLD